jgi:hypothetical protein
MAKMTMKDCPSPDRWHAAAGIVCMIFLVSLSAHAEPVLHEPFDYPTNETIDGKPVSSGTGLAGNWAGTTKENGTTGNFGLTTVKASSKDLDYGTLPRSGGQLQIAGAANMVAQVDTAALKNAGLLADGATLWISFLLRASEGSGTNHQQSFAFGTDEILADQFAQKMTNAGSGVGISFNRGKKLNIAYWDKGARKASENDTARVEATHLVVLAITWGPSSETIQLYRPGTDLAQPDPAETVTTTGNLDQSTFDTITYSHRGTGAFDEIDEIRFGSSYTDVVPGGTAPSSPGTAPSSPGTVPKQPEAPDRKEPEKQKSYA